MDEAPELPTTKTGNFLKYTGYFFMVVVPSAIASVPFAFPETVSTKANEAVIESTVHHDVDDLKKEVKAELLVEFKERLDKADKEHNRCNAKIVGLQSKITALEVKAAALNRHCDYNTQMCSIHSDIIWEELDANNNTCNYPYRESNSKDDYGMFDGLYNSRPIYSVDLRSGCRVYCTPIFENKKQIH